MRKRFLFSRTGCVIRRRFKGHVPCFSYSFIGLASKWKGSRCEDKAFQKISMKITTRTLKHRYQEISGTKQDFNKKKSFLRHREITRLCFVHKREIDSTISIVIQLLFYFISQIVLVSLWYRRLSFKCSGKFFNLFETIITWKKSSRRSTVLRE